MRKLTRADAQALAAKLVKESPGCPICQRTWEEIKAEYAAKLAAKGLVRKQVPWVLDHDHGTGQCRGVLCRGCNGAEGKVANIAATWGKAGQNTEATAEWVHRLSAYLKVEPLNFIYPTHQTAEMKVKAGDMRKEMARKKAAARRKQLAESKKRG